MQVERYKIIVTSNFSMENMFNGTVLVVLQRTSFQLKILIAGTADHGESIYITKHLKQKYFSVTQIFI